MCILPWTLNPEANKQTLSSHMMCIHVYAYEYIYIYRSIRLYIHTFIHIYIYTYINIYIYKYIHIYLHIYIYILMEISLCILCVYIYIYLYLFKTKYIYTYTYAYMYVYMCPYIDSYIISSQTLVASSGPVWHSKGSQVPLSLTAGVSGASLRVWGFSALWS